MTLDDLGARLPWRAAGAWLAHAGPGTALFREANPETAPWLDGRITAALAADVCDAVNGLAYLFARAHARNPGAVPPWRALPRPWDAPDEGRGDGGHYGSGPIAAADFAGWWAEHAR